MRTFVVELGSGADLHGGNATTAAVRAVKDCFNHVSLTGLFSVAGLNDPNEMEIDVYLGVPDGLDPVDVVEVSSSFPFGNVTVHEETGGLRAPGGAGDDDFITVVNAAILVKVP